jgi:hypothetical protein
MGAVDIITLLRRRPFTPFQLISSDGTRYAVVHPELALVSPTAAVIGYPHPEIPGAALRYDVVSMRHIVRLELPAEDAPAADNGAAAP